MRYVCIAPFHSSTGLPSCPLVRMGYGIGSGGSVRTVMRLGAPPGVSTHHVDAFYRILGAPTSGWCGTPYCGTKEEAEERYTRGRRRAMPLPQFSPSEGASKPSMHFRAKGEHCGCTHFASSGVVGYIPYQYAPIRHQSALIYKWLACRPAERQQMST